MRSAIARLSPAVPPANALVIVATLAIGLLVDVLTDIPGQLVLSAVVWVILFYVLRGAAAEERRALMACLVSLRPRAS